MKRLLLVGGGHAQLEVLRELQRAPIPGVEPVLVSPGRYAAYTGMVPGYLAGRYASEEIRFDLAALAAAAGARFIDGVVTHIDGANRVAMVDDVALPFDACSVNVGPAPAGTQVRGMREHALPLRPLANARVLLERVEALRAREGDARCVVVGGGAAGVEVALAVAARGGPRLRVALVYDTPELLLEYPASAGKRVSAACARAGITCHPNERVTEVSADQVACASGATLPTELTVWVAGAAPPPLIGASALPRSSTGYLAVDDTLRAIDESPVWGAGDCITIREHPWVPKAGVYAVRAGPILAHNLRAHLQGSGPPRRFSPQSGFLSLLALGDGTALLRWRGVVIESGWAMSLKDRIDRAFMARYAMV